MGPFTNQILFYVNIMDNGKLQEVISRESKTSPWWDWKLPSEYLLQTYTRKREMTHREETEVEERKAKMENSCIDSRHSAIPLLCIAVLLPALLHNQ